MSQVQQAVHVRVWKVAKELAAAGLPCIRSLVSVLKCIALSIWQRVQHSLTCEHAVHLLQAHRPQIPAHQSIASEILPVWKAVGPDEQSSEGPAANVHQLSTIWCSLLTPGNKSAAVHFPY